MRLLISCCVLLALAEPALARRVAVQQPMPIRPALEQPAVMPAAAPVYSSATPAAFSVPSVPSLSDQPVLRGSHVIEPRAPDVFKWSGVYGGGQFGFNVGSADFAGGTESLVAFALRETALENEQHPSLWQVLGQGYNRSAGYGVFLGTNWQWEDAVVGFELNYTRPNFSAIAPNSPITRAVTAGGNNYSVTLTGSGSLEMTDILTTRLRGGWAYDCFLPYAFLGFSLARANVTRSVTIPLTENGVPFTFSDAEKVNGAFMYGFSAGGGLDYALMAHLFLRADYEFDYFLPVMGIQTQLHQFRLGLGYTF